MAGLEALVRLVLEKAWALGILLFVFFGLSWVLDSHGVNLPPLVKEWKIPGAVAGLTLAMVSIVNWTVTGISRLVTDRRNSQRQRKLDASNAVRNIQTLSPEEMAALVEMLTSAASRFDVEVGSPAARLLPKGILTVAHESGPLSAICEIHPAVIDRREALIREFSKWLEKNPRDDLILRPGR